MSEKTTLEGVSRRVQGLKDRLERLEKDVRQLKDILNVHDNWHAEIRELVGKRVRIKDFEGLEFTATLKWSDRYNLAVEYFPTEAQDGSSYPSKQSRTRTYNKGGIIWIEPCKE